GGVAGAAGRIVLNGVIKASFEEDSIAAPKQEDRRKIGKHECAMLVGNFSELNFGVSDNAEAVGRQRAGGLDRHRYRLGGGCHGCGLRWCSRDNLFSFGR